MKRMMTSGPQMSILHTDRFVTKRGAALLALCILLALAMMLIAGCGGDGSGAGTGSSAGAPAGDPDEGEAAGDEIEGLSLGEWQDSYMVSERDDKPYPVKVRFTQIDTDQEEVKKQIDAFNVSAAGSMIPVVEDPQYMYVIAHYEVAFPEDYPDGDYGITNVAPAFTITAADGGDVITTNNTNYSGLTQTFEIGYQPRGYDFHAGDTYEGAIVYLMAAGYTNYRILEVAETPEGTPAQHYYMAR